MQKWKTTCLVAGGGPAGMVLAYLLARAGVQTILVEKHSDFLRDFRGDTVHPSTTELMRELGILEEFLREVPHQAMEQLGIGFKGQTFDLIDFRHLPTACKYVVFMPQWDFLKFMADKGKHYRSFRLEMNTEVTDLLWEGSRVTGVTARNEETLIEIRADVTVACDGRWSVIRERSRLPVTEFPMPIDVLWFRVPRAHAAPESLGYLGEGQIVIAINRDNHRQGWLRSGSGRGTTGFPVQGRLGSAVSGRWSHLAYGLEPGQIAVGSRQPLAAVVVTGLVVYRGRRTRDVSGRRDRRQLRDRRCSGHRQFTRRTVTQRSAW